MSLLHLAYIIARRRIISSWQLELVVFLGILLSVALLASSVVFSNLLAEAALRRTLQEAAPEDVNIWVRTFNGLDDPRVTGRASAYQTSIDFVNQRIGPRLPGVVRDQNRLFETATFFFAGHSQLELAREDRPRGRIQHMTAVGDPTYTELIAGRWAQPAVSADGPLEVVVDERGAGLLQLGVGDSMEVFPASGAQDYATMNVEIVGVFRRLDTSSLFWDGQEKDFSYQDDRWIIVPMFTSEEAILKQVGLAYPGIYTNVTWVFNLDREGVRAGDVNTIQQTIRTIRAEVFGNLENGSTSIKLDQVLSQYSEQLLLARIPLFLMVFLVVGILAYYLALVAGLTVRSRSAEIAMLKSRGSTTFQISLLMLVEGLLLAVPAVVLGTLLSPLVARTLGGLFFEVQRSVAPNVSLGAFLLGVGGALLAVGVLTVSTLVAARRSIVEFRQSGARPSTAPFIHRYYLDFLALAIIGLIWWQIQSRGTLLVRSFGTNQLDIDFTLLLGPVLGLLALGLLVLRLFPLVVGVLARITEPVGPVWLVQGLRRVSRDPIVPGSLVVLLMLATALGVIGSAFSSTLERSQRDRARYEAGADLRLLHTGNTTPVSSQGLADSLKGISSVQDVADVDRISGRLLTQGFGTTGVSTLAVDANNFGKVAWYRPDFSPGHSLPELISALASSESLGEDGIKLPEDTTGLWVWAHPDRPNSGIIMHARLRDSRGLYFDVSLGDLGAQGWQRLEADLQSAEPRSRSRGSPSIALTPPFTLLALHISGRSGINSPGAVFLDSLSALTPQGDQALPNLGNLERWHTIQDYSRPGLYALESSASVTRVDSQPSAAFSWAPGGLGLRGLRYGSVEEPLPAVVSNTLLEAADVQMGDTLSLGMSTFAVPIKVVATADFFPTLDPRQQPFAIVDLKSFIHYANRHNQSVVGGPNEVWVRLSSDPDAASAVIYAARASGIPTNDTLLATELVHQRIDQPLTNASWGGLLVLMFLALVIASASGVVLFSYMDTRERQTEFTLLRTLGSSKRQVNGVVWFSLFLVMVSGIGVGTWAGQQIGASILPVLEFAEGGARVTPPMVLQTNWVILLISYLVLAGVAVGTVVWLAWLTAKLELQQVLRAGEATR